MPRQSAAARNEAKKFAEAAKAAPKKEKSPSVDQPDQMATVSTLTDSLQKLKIEGNEVKKGPKVNGAGRKYKQRTPEEYDAMPLHTLHKNTTERQRVTFENGAFYHQGKKIYSKDTASINPLGVQTVHDAFEDLINENGFVTLDIKLKDLAALNGLL